MSNYYLNRISNEWKVSKALLCENNESYISIGFKDYIDKNNPEALLKTNVKEFEQAVKNSSSQTDNGELGNLRQRWTIWRFAKYQKGDYILVPMENKDFSIYKVIESPCSIFKLKGKEFKIDRNINKTKIKITDDGLVLNDEIKDIGFVAKVEKVRERIKRSFASPSLVARMKIRNTLAEIDDLSVEIDKVINSEKDFSIEENIINNIMKSLIPSIEENVTPDGLENLIKWLMEKIGAEYAIILPKNPKEKESEEDADVKASFSDLKLNIYIQAKKHEGKTHEEGVNQIKKYKQLIEKKVSIDDDEKNYNNLYWVITTAKEFSEDAKNIAKENNIRLICIEEFARMLLDAGLKNLSEVENFYKK